MVGGGSGISGDLMSDDMLERDHELREIARILAGARLASGHPNVPIIAITGTEGAGTSRVLAETADIGRRLGYRLGPRGRGEALAAGTRQALGAVPQDAPVLLTVDEAHLTGADDLVMLHVRAQEAANAPVVLAAAGRQRDDGTADWLPADDTAVTRLSLRPLTQDAVREIIARRVGAPPTDTLARFAAQAGGNPLLVTELITGLVEEGAVRVVNDRSAMLRAVPSGRVELLVRQRLAALPRPYQQLLQVAAALSGRPDPLRIRSIAQLSGAERDVLDQASSSILLRRSDAYVRFRSVLAWLAVRNSMPALLRAIVKTGDPGDASRDRSADQAIPSRPRRGESHGSDTGPACPWCALTDTERTIAVFVSEGLTNREIARRVFLSPHTVNYHLRNTFRKLGIASRVALAGITAGRHPHDHPRGPAGD
ncbi:LuxR C-terminal-related transcriptional regulator [Micromonospora sp. NPDC093277]|uniref:helix-turn-helix transcriptional regulator n=1 Tax=Micromonospora sp. NPDC093277 TaxID=3364291 RepID=UPI0037F4B056